MVKRRVIAAVVLLAAAGLDARSAAGQTSADLFNDQVLQRIDLYVNTRDWYLLRARYMENEYYPANLKWNGTTVTNVAIRSRGTGSRSPVKPALRVDFNRYATGRTFLGLTAVDLNNATQDPSSLREALAMKFYRAMGIPAPRAAPAALYVNNTYFGLYLLVEEIDEAAIARLFGESGGYLFEYKWTFPWQFEYLELGAFIRLVAVQAFIGEADGLLGNWGVNNHYLYRASQKNLHRFIVWDASSSFHLSDYPLDAGHAESVLMRRAMSVPGLKAAYRDTLLEAAALADQVEGPGTPEAPARGWLEREAVRLLDLIRDTAYADKAKPFTNAEFDEAASMILAFARSRGDVARRVATRFAPTAGMRDP